MKEIELENNWEKQYQWFPDTMEKLTESDKRWYPRFLDLAMFVSSWSKDKTKCGAVVFDSDIERVVSLGYNGFPQEVPDNDRYLKSLSGDNRQEKLYRIAHAEVNALLFKNPSALNCFIFVVGKPICNNCAQVIIQAKIKRVIALHPACEKLSSEWRNLGFISLEMFRDAGIETYWYDTLETIA